MIEFDIDHIASDLAEDGDTYVLTRAVSDLLGPKAAEEEGAGVWTFKLRIEGDDTDVESMTDPEVFGRFEYGEYGRTSRSRPDGFTGAAVKIDSDSSQGTFFWYEPPKDFRKFKGSGFATIEEWEAAKKLNLKYVRNLLSWGYISIGIELTHRRPDGYKRSWSAWIGGVESDTGLWGQPLDDHNAYVQELIKEQIGEVLAQINERQAA